MRPAQMCDSTADEEYVAMRGNRLAQSATTAWKRTRSTSCHPAHLSVQAVGAAWAYGRSSTHRPAAAGNGGVQLCEEGVQVLNAILHVADRLVSLLPQPRCRPPLAQPSVLRRVVADQLPVAPPCKPPPHGSLDPAAVHIMCTLVPDSSCPPAEMQHTDSVHMLTGLPLSTR
jgi:hypothetical protein